ncbi:MAG: hypothetical protein HOF69_03455 [Campylobacteraceae bacterium]|jgi:hypothetical protein|nr:hypothetical protein [Campylobacteraceae bacterium]MBT3882300.1 hypothetical protein [Campylobacteraceae bacterium]MBT4030216.1 hypothetical protein [Campylobacteraceae bacterium]MBT4179273.1 hypothetical protein [Campylobacteraceae bacterium]MBT4572134.1 hypothetical protein [Campylobacteraceae bacterium]
MKIEFRKIPFEAKDFSFTSNSVIFEGNFGKISPTLAKFDAKMSGTIPSSCYKCGENMDLEINETIDFIVSDGIYSDDKHEETVIEVDNNIIDFDQLIDSEITSINSDYHVCSNCNSNDLFEKEL